ncbi:MAG: Mur ligase family protein, partial [Candidatus Omnitrophica bacterium]|nr:Mur ligase family protein [Candidatus Omnitrophota bacterium]
MTYPQVIKYLNSFINYERLSGYRYEESFELERFKRFLEYIGNPRKDLRVIHVAGSKGKGSTCAFISHILKEAGFKVGLYTSPHLNDFRERIRILQQRANSKSQIVKSNEFEGMIFKSDICGLVSKLKPAIDKFNKNQRYGGLTLFEAYTAIALKYFKDKKVDFAVLETGLGGRLDATNTCNSLISVFAPISLEHTYLLGDNLGKIAFEKASIIKKENKTAVNGKKIAVSSAQGKSAMNMIEKIANKNNTVLLKEGTNFKFSAKRNNVFDYKGVNHLENLRISLIGRHQAANAALAIASVEALQYH